MAQKYDDSEGVWRTIGGRKVFIKNGQSLSDAMKQSGKFKPAKKGSTDGKKPMSQEEFSKKIDEITKSKSYKEKMDKAVDELNEKYGYKKDEKSNNEEYVGDIPKKSYDIADEIESKFGDKEKITRDEFEQFLTGKYDDEDADIRGILAQQGWETKFESDDEGDEGDLVRLKQDSSTDANAQELEKEGIKKISSKESSKYVEDWTNHENRDDYGKYYSQDGDKFVAIDNSAGECYVEEFDNEKDAIDYLKGKDPEEIRASKEKSNGSTDTKTDNNDFKINAVENTGGGVYAYGGEVGNYTFIAGDGGIEYFDKSQGMTLEKYLALEDDAWNGKYGKDIKDGYDYEQKYAKYGVVPEEVEKKILDKIDNDGPEKIYKEIKDGPKEDYVNDDEKGLEYSFRTNDRDMFEVRYNRTGNNKNMDFSTSASKFNRNRTDYEQAGQAQKDILAEGTKAREFFDKWDKKHLGSLTQKEYEELANDIEELKKEYPYVEGSRFNDQVELDRSSKKASKSKANNTTNEAIKTRNNAIDNEILDRYSKDYGYDSDDNLKNLKSQIDYMRNPNESINRTAQRLVDGGDFLIYNGDVKDWLKSNNIKYNEGNYWDVYRQEMADRIEKLYNQKETPKASKSTNETMNDKIRDEAYRKYMKEHPNSKITLEDFLKNKKK